MNPEDQLNDVPPVRTCLALSISYFLVYTAFNGIQNLQSSVNTKENLGVLSLALSYGTIILFSPLASFHLRLIGAKNMVLLCWLTLAVYTASNFVPMTATFVAAGVLKGFGCSGIGMTQGMYLAAASESYIRRNHLSEEYTHAVLSIINGVFFTCLESTQISGNLISSFILKTWPSRHDENDTDSSITALSPVNGSWTPGLQIRQLSTQDIPVCGADVCFYEDTSAVGQAIGDARTALFSAYMICNVIGFIVAWLFLPRMRQSSDKGAGYDAVNHLTSCLRAGLDWRCALVLPAFGGQAMMLMTIYTGFTKAFVSCSAGVEWVGFVMTAYGVFCAVCATLVSLTARYTGRVFLMVLFIVLDFGLLVTMSIWQPESNSRETLPGLFLIASVAGVTEAISQPQINAFISSVFEDNRAPTFVVYHTTKCIGFTVALFLSYSACFYHLIYTTLFLCLLGLIGYVTLEIIIFKTKKGDNLCKKDDIVDKQKSQDMSEESDVVCNLDGVSENYGSLKCREWKR